jgi:hypothetical protein
LPNLLIPGPLLYLPGAEALVIANSNLEVECYSFTALMSATDNKINAQKEAQAKEDSGKIETSRLKPEWVANLGEQAMHIVLHENLYSLKRDIVVSCE